MFGSLRTSSSCAPFMRPCLSIHVHRRKTQILIADHKIRTFSSSDRTDFRLAAQFPCRNERCREDRLLLRNAKSDRFFHTVIEIRRRTRQCAVCKLCHAAGQEHVLPSKGIPPIRHAAAAQGIGDEANSVGKQLECHTNGTRMDVVSIANELGNHILPFAGSPDRARLPVMDRRHGIIEMCQVACTCIKDIAGVVVGAVRMGNRDCAKLACPPGKCCRARQLRRHIHNAKKPLRDVI